MWEIAAFHEIADEMDVLRPSPAVAGHDMRVRWAPWQGLAASTAVNCPGGTVVAGTTPNNDVCITKAWVERWAVCMACGALAIECAIMRASKDLSTPLLDCET